MIKSINIEKLYNRFDYEISFENRNVTIITGPNGYGKTTILNIINWLSKNELNKIKNLEFLRIVIKTIDEKIFTIEKNDEKLIINDKYIPLGLSDNSEYKDSYIKSYRDYEIESEIRRHEKIYYKDEYIYNIYKEESGFLSNKKNKKIYKEAKTVLEGLKESLGKVYFIKEQRLLKENKNYSHLKKNSGVIDVINNLPNKFKKIISKISSDYSSISNQLDSSYPTRLFEMQNGIDENEYKFKIKEMGKKFEKLSKYDISDMQNISNVVFKEEHSKALKVYFDDFNTKYKVYEDLIAKLDLFVGIVNDRLQFKEVRISREDGIIVVDDQERNIKLSHLSSGEKQEIVLFFELIFDTEKEAILLIDEPEISLHIAWQKRFMDDLTSICSKMEFKAVVATHSPQIIGNHWDKQVDLGELYG